VPADVELSMEGETNFRSGREERTECNQPPCPKNAQRLKFVAGKHEAVHPKPDEVSQQRDENSHAKFWKYLFKTLEIGMHPAYQREEKVRKQ
jgi:hypothetical protein